MAAGHEGAVIVELAGVIRAVPSAACAGAMVSDAAVATRLATSGECVEIPHGRENVVQFDRRAY